MIVCLCSRVSDRDIEAAIRLGAATVDAITMATGACAGCQACRGCIEDRLNRPLEAGDSASSNTGAIAAINRA